MIGDFIIIQGVVCGDMDLAYYDAMCHRPAFQT